MQRIISSLNSVYERHFTDRWTKGFEATGVVGEDVVQLLEKAIAKNGVRFHSTIVLQYAFCIYVCPLFSAVFFTVIGEKET